MLTETKAQVAYELWEHYRTALDSGQFVNEQHIKNLQEKEQFYQNKYLELSDGGEDLQVFYVNGNGITAGAPGDFK